MFVRIRVLLWYHSIKYRRFVNVRKGMLCEKKHTKNRKRLAYTTIIEAATTFLQKGVDLTHRWDLNKMDAVLQTKFGKDFSLNKMIQIYWCSLLWVELTINIISSGTGSIPIRCRAVTWTNDDIVHAYVCHQVPLIQNNYVYGDWSSHRLIITSIS